MARLARLIFVLPLIIATCFVAILNGNVLCMAGGDHIAVEAKHEPGGCTASGPCSGHDDAEPHGGGCSDVSADLDLLRDGNRSSVDVATAELPYYRLEALASSVIVNPAVSPLLRAGLAPPSVARAASLRSIVLII